MLKSWYINFFLLLGVLSVQGAVVSPFNKRSLQPLDSCCYSFIVSGHFHGASSNSSGFPASSLLANLDTLIRMKPDFMVSLGDIFLKASEAEIQNYEKALFSRLPFPLFNSPGNHDLSEVYKKRYAPTWFSFTHGTEAYLFLDTEINDGSISDVQYDSLRSFLKKSSAGNAIRNIFIFSHRPVWAEENKKYNALFTDNTQSLTGVNYEKEILPLLKEIKGRNIYWIAGSMGGTAPSSFFYEQNDNLTYIATSIRDLPRDGVLMVRVENGKVAFNTFSLTSQKVLTLEEYNVDYWQKNKKVAGGFSLRLLPYLFRQMITHSYFWSGFSFAFVISLIVFFRRRRNVV